MIKNVLSSIGVGGASVDTVLDDSDVVVGGSLSGEVRIRGGSTEQDIRAVVLELVTRALVERGDEKHHAQIVLTSARQEPGRVAPGEARTLPFRIAVPDWAPLSVGSTQTALRTRLDVAWAVDPTDSDRLRILPNPAMSAVLDGLEAAGFRLAEVEVEYNGRRSVPFVQEFDFRPLRGGDWGIEEVEISFSPLRGGVEVLLTVDNRGGFFTAGRERSARFRVTDADLGRLDLARELRRAIDSLRR